MVWIKMGETDILAAHAALLPTGKILHFSGSEYNADAHNHGRNDHTRLYDCATGEVTAVGSPVQDLFCCGHSLLGDGRLFAAGGTAAYALSKQAGGAHLDHWPGLRNSWTYDPATSHWVEQALMLPEPQFIAAPGSEARAVTRRGMLQVFWVTRDGGIATQFWPERDEGRVRWSQSRLLVPAGSHLAGVPGGSVSAVSRGPDKLDIFWTGADGAVHTHFFSEAKPWAEHGPFTLVRGDSPVKAVGGGSVSAVSRGPDKLDIFWTGADGAVDSLWWTESDGWGLNHRTGFGITGGGRWYPTLVTLSDGRVLALGGHPSFTDNRHWNNSPEIYDPVTETWTVREAIGDLGAFVQYPRMHVLPDATVFCATPLEVETKQSLRYDITTGEAGEVAPLFDNDYYPAAIASSIDTTSVLLPLRPSDGYRPAVLLCGGSMALRIELADEQPKWQPTGQRQLPPPDRGTT